MDCFKYTLWKRLERSLSVSMIAADPVDLFSHRNIYIYICIYIYKCFQLPIYIYIYIYIISNARTKIVRQAQ